MGAYGRRRDETDDFPPLDRHGTTMNANYRNFALWVIIFLLVLALVTLFQSPGQKAPSSEITFSQLLTDADGGNIRDVTIAGPEITGHMKDGRAFQTYAPNDPTLVQTLFKKDVAITAKPPSDGNNWLLTIVSSVLPVLLFLGLWIYMTRQMQGGAGKAMGFGKSKAKLLTEAQGRVTFEDVAGIDEAKEDLQEVVEFLRDPQKFQQLGKDAGDDRQEPVVPVGRRLGGDRDVLLEQGLDKRRVVRRIGLERAPVLHVAVDLLPRDGHVANVARLGVGQKLAEGDLARRRFLARALKQSDQGEHEQENDHPQGEVSVVCVHRLPVTDGRRRNLHPLPALSLSAHLSAPARIAKRTARLRIRTLSDN